MSINLSVLGSARARAIKRTTSVCPVCHLAIPADVLESGGRVLMRKTCPTHGDFETVLAADPRFYFESLGSASGACCGGSGCCSPASASAAVSADPFETLSTCIALIEIVDSCNLTCPTCYAASPFGVDEQVKCTPFDEFVRRVSGVISRKGFVDILQLSGGEPTIHPEFFRLLEWALDQKQIGYLLINTNAVRVAVDAEFRERLAAARFRRGAGPGGKGSGFELYVQFDGPQEAGQKELRGADLRDIRRKAIGLAGALGVPSTLAMTVTPQTLPHLGDTLRFGLARPHCRGVSLQPMFTSGRVPVESSTLPIARHAPAPISVGDVVCALAAQAPEVLTAEDFTPLPCGDPNCHTIGYLLRTAEGVKPLSRLVDLESLQGFLKDRVDYRLEDLAKCGCESEPLGELIKSLELSPESPFRIFIKPFMDAWTFDQDRIDRCCTHVILPDGRLDSFCRHYLTRSSEEACRTA